VPVPAHRDAVLVAYLTACALAVVQFLVLEERARTAVASVPYAVALMVVLLLRARGPQAPRGPGSAGWRRTLSWFMIGLAAWVLVSFLSALPGHVGEPHSFYRVKLAVTTPLGDHNTAAGLLLVGIVVCAGRAAEDRRWVLGTAVVAAGVIGTLSRGAAAVLLVVALLGALLGSSRTFRVVLGAASVAVLAGILLAANLLDASPPPGATVPDGPAGTSVVGRIDLALRGVERGAAHPVLGAGLGSFASGAESLPPPNDHAHQLLAHAFAEGGVVLLAIALAVPVALAVRGWARPAGPLRDLALLGGAGLVGHAQFEILGGRLGYELLLAVLAALVTPHVPSGRHEAGPTTATPRNADDLT
jgi:hypothetical protein